MRVPGRCGEGAKSRLPARCWVRGTHSRNANDFGDATITARSDPLQSLWRQSSSTELPSTAVSCFAERQNDNLCVAFPFVTARPSGWVLYGRDSLSATTSRTSVRRSCRRIGCFTLKLAGQATRAIRPLPTFDLLGRPTASDQHQDVSPGHEFPRGLDLYVARHPIAGGSATPPPLRR